MQPRRLRSLTVALAVVWSLPASAQKPLPPSEAMAHISEEATVFCGQVVSTIYAARSKGQPTFLNPDKPYPHAVFTVLIWALIAPSSASLRRSSRTSVFASPGGIQEYRDGAKIVATELDQIRLEAEP